MSVRPCVSFAASAAASNGSCCKRTFIHPPVMGGKKAISRAPAIAASALTWARSTAARITRGFSNAWAYSSLRRASQFIRSPTVTTPAGGSISSSGLPMRSRTQAKYKSFTSLVHHVSQSGAEIVPARIQRHDGREPQQGEADAGGDGQDFIARLAGQQEADGDELG